MLPLVSFGNDIPVGLVALDTMSKHPTPKEIVVANTYVAPAVQILPQLNDEAIANTLDKFLLGRFRQIVIILGRFVPETRNSNSNRCLGLNVGNGIMGSEHKPNLHNAALCACLWKYDRLTAESVDKPLPEIRRKFDVDCILVHNYV